LGQWHGNLAYGCYHTQLHFEVDHQQRPNPGQELGQVQQLHKKKSVLYFKLVQKMRSSFYPCMLLLTIKDTLI
jgi:hypothetical protein